MSRYRADHPAVVNLTAEMKEQKRAMVDELRRIAEVYKSDAEVSRLREAQLSQEMDKRIEHAAGTKEAQITAAELDTVAQTFRRMYESYLQTLAEAVQRESFPVSDARVISSASKPLGASSPRSKLVIAVSVLAGAIVGIGLAVLRQSLDRNVRSPRQLRRELEVECLGLVPLVRRGHWRALLNLWAKLARRGPRPSGNVLDVEERPASVFTGALLGVKTSIDLAAQIQSLGCLAVTSLSPGEGKSTVAYNLAKLFALCGTRTLLIGGDLHASGEGKGVPPARRKDLLDVLHNPDLLPEAKISNERLPLDVLSSGNRLAAQNSCGLLGLEGMRQILETARKDYGIVIVDLPSLKVTADARAISPCVDGVIMVAEAGKTPTDILGEAMQDLAAARANILGVVLNKVDERPLRKHGNLAAAYYT
jgi:succinoglycan biosynthesis transport protein ExoP